MGGLDERPAPGVGNERLTSGILPDTAALNNVNEEMGADFAVNDAGIFGGEIVEDKAESGTKEEDRGYALGWFIWPVLLGATAAVLGFIAYKEGARGLGGWSMAIGLFALVLNLIIVPFYYAIT
jgi:hypothetical protein